MFDEERLQGSSRLANNSTSPAAARFDVSVNAVREGRPMSEASRPKKKKKKNVDGESRALSYVMGAFLILLGVGLMAGYIYLERGPGKLFHLLAAGGVGSLFSGIGLFIQPLDSEK